MDIRERLKAGLTQRGLAPHVADAFIMNFQDESGLNPGINEASPIVPGSRGGFGLYQLTGPRRRQYEAFAQQRGAPLADVDAQLDFMMTELQGSESRAAKNIFAAKDTGTAAAAIVNDFLRPSPEHRQRRTARYLGGGGSNDTLAGGLSISPQRAPDRLQPQGGQPPMQAPQQAPQKATGILGGLFPDMTADRQDRLSLALSGLSMNPNQAVMQQAQQRIGDRREDGKQQQAQQQQTQQRNQTAAWLATQPGGQQYAEAILSGVPANQVLQMYQAQSKGQGPVERGLTPQYGVDADGNPVLIQLGKDGTATQTQMPDGVSLSREPIRIDAGTEWVLLDPITRQPISTIPKNNREAAAETSAGRVEGTAAAENQAAASSDLQAGQNALELLESIRTDPARGIGTGKSSVVGLVPGTKAYDFKVKVEQAKSGAFMTAIQQMRGMGALSNAEGKTATAAVTRMNTALTDEGFLEALDDYEKIIRQGIQKAERNGGIAADTAPAASGEWQDVNGVKIRIKQ